MSGARGSARSAWVGAALLLALGVVAVTTTATFGAFSGTTSNGSNSFAAASSFCVGSSSTVNPDNDTHVEEDHATTNYGSITTMDTKPDSTKHRRSMVHFSLPSIPQYCVVTGATLRLNASAAAAGHTIEVFRAATSWTESGPTWNNQPQKAGGAVSTSAATGYITWDVTSMVKDMYTHSDYGFVVRDANDAAGSPNGVSTFSTKEASSNKPELVVTFGAGSSADTISPLAMDIALANGAATSGKPETGDTMTFTFSEPMSASSIMSGWSGSSTNVVVRATNTGNVDDTFQVYDSTNTTLLNLGTVDTNGDYVTANITFGASGTASTMVMSGNTVTVTLGTASDASKERSDGNNNVNNWTPSASSTDTSGNACNTSAATESGAADKDF